MDNPFRTPALTARFAICYIDFQLRKGANLTYGRRRRILGASMSVLMVFGKNLRLLSKERGTQSTVADEIGVSKVQFQRYLRGESFPKPNLLQKICCYFGVDARILTSPIDEAGLFRLREGRNPFEEGTPIYPMEEAVRFVFRDQAPATQDDTLPDGFYLAWRHAMSQRGRFSCTLHQVRSLSMSRVARSYDLKAVDPGTSEPFHPREREMRAMVHRQSTGHALFYYHDAPWNMLAVTYLNVFTAMNAGALLVGFSVLCRDDMPGMNRISRTAWKRVEGDCGSVLRAARACGLHEAAAVPPNILGLIAEPVG